MHAPKCRLRQSANGVFFVGTQPYQAHINCKIAQKHLHRPGKLLDALLIIVTSEQRAAQGQDSAAVSPRRDALVRYCLDTVGTGVQQKTTKQ